jgi:two-component system nitrogen regulation response regulator GlnG/two-component system response regulator HydG
VLAWSLDEPDRIGEVIPIEIAHVIGRGKSLPDDIQPRAGLHRMRPGELIEQPPIANARVSRKQLLVERQGEEAIRIRSIGAARVRVNGTETTDAVARPGDVVEIHNAAVFVVAMRPVMLPEQEGIPYFPFGTADAFGIVGESEAAWKLREAIVFAASTDRHVLVLGESGVGKELAARAIHGLSAQRKEKLVARNAATLPESLIDAELFGNVKNYPNPGMPERAGLIGEADGSTLFLDEIGDLPEKCQVHLLRVLDAGGEYQRLGESTTKRSSLRLVAATNRAPELLKHDFLARFTHRIALPGLTERKEDIPLVLAELLQRTARSNPAVADKFFEQRNSTLAEPRLAPDLVVRLLRHPFTHHVRELERIVWLAIGTAERDYIGVTPAVDAELSASADAETDATSIDRDTLAQALADNGRSPTKTAKVLGLKNRFVLLRLLKKHGLSVAGDNE